MELIKIKKDFENIIKKINPKIYYDVNFKRENNCVISCDKINNRNNFDEDLGYKIRLFNGKNFIEFGNSNIKNFEEDFKKILKKIKFKFLKKNVLDKNDNFLEKDFNKKKTQKIDVKKNTKKIQILKNKILKLDKKIIDCRIGFKSNFEESFFLSNKKKLSQKIIYEILFIAVFIKTKVGVKEVYTYKINENNIFNFEKEIINSLKNKIKTIQNSKKLKGGNYEVLLSESISGLLAHESFGHGMEADTIIKNRAKAKNYIGKKITNSQVNIVDYGNIKNTNGQIFFDSDGQICEKIYLVKNGILNNPMMDKFSKLKLKSKKNSCSSRFENYDSKNYVRMTNTYFENGKSKKANMLKKIKNGIYIISSHGGMEDPKTWGVQIQNCFGQKIKNGKLVNEFYDGFTISGNLLDIMENVEEIGNDLNLNDIGYCGKGHKEWVRVSSGGPHMRIKKMLLG